MEKHSVARLIAPLRASSARGGGALTEDVTHGATGSHFDEIEKAHPDVFNVLG